MAVQCRDFIHHLLINGQTSGGIDQQHVDKFFLRLPQRCIDDGKRGLAGVGPEKLDVYFTRQRLKLLNRSRPVDICADQHDPSGFRPSLKFSSTGAFVVWLNRLSL